MKRGRDKEIIDMINANIDVPYHDEFFKYIQWHNNAVTMEWMHGYPTYILHYEDLKADELRLDVLCKIASFLKWNVSLLNIELSQEYMPIFRN